MGLFSKLFGSHSPPPRDVAALLASHSKPGVRLAPSERETGSWLGGRPALPQGCAWPCRQGRPLAFLAQLDLAALAQACELDWLPGSGSLAFFYDTVEQPWGYDPAHASGWHVEFVAEPAGPLDPPAGAAPPPCFEQRWLAPQRVLLLPDLDPQEYNELEFSDRELDQIGELEEAMFEHGPQHHVGGHPSPVQTNTMELESQLVSHGIDLDTLTSLDDPRAQHLAAGAQEWRLLLQLDSDPDLDWSWGEGGRLYFWVRASEAREGDFQGVWMILQST